MEWLKDLGIAGFMFFLIKGLVWIVLFLLVYFGVLDKEKVKAFRTRFSLKSRRSQRNS